MIKRLLIVLLIAAAPALYAQTDTILPLDISAAFTLSPDHVPGCEYYFLAPHDGFNLIDPEFRSALIIVDRNAELLFFKGLPGNSDQFFNFVFDFKLQPNGQLSFHNQAGPNTKHYVLDSTLRVVDSVEVQLPFYSDSHELLLTPDGHKYVMGLDYRTMNLDTLTAQGGFQMSSQTIVEGGVILVMDQNNNIVFQWSGFDYFDISDMDYTNLTDTAYVDFMHFNSISLDSAGNLIVSIRNFNEVVKINRQTGAIMWRLGGKNSDFTFPNDPFGGFTLQHHATLLPNGNITILDNGTYHNPPTARSIEYELDEINGTATLVWGYRNEIESISIGSTQLLPNGNRLINWGADIDAFYSPIVEVTDDYEEVLNIDLPPGYFTYRALCYDLPWEVKRPEITCDSTNGSITLSVDSGFQSYFWLQLGDTSQTVTVTDTGSYQVFGHNGYGWVGSAIKRITNISNPCDTVVGINELVKSQTRLYPNPSKGLLHLDLPKGMALNTINIAIYNTFGQQMDRFNSLETEEVVLPTHHYPAGTYVVRINGEGIQWQGKFAVLH